MSLRWPTGRGWGNPVLDKLSSIIHMENIRLYRDDGLSVTRKAPGPEMEHIKKKLIAIFKMHGLKVTADANLLPTDLLDATIDFKFGKFWPYRKPNGSGHHPSSITKQLPRMINNRITQPSCYRESFNNAIPPYAEALKKAGHSPRMACPMHSTISPNRKKSRKRNITCFNPPNNRLHKIYDKFNVKLNFSCMPNMARMAKSHNGKLTNPPPKLTRCHATTEQNLNVRLTANAEPNQIESQIVGEGKRGDRLVGAAYSSKEHTEWRRLQRKNLNILGLLKREEWPQCHRESSWQVRQSQKEKEQSRQSRAPDREGGRESR